MGRHTGAVTATQAPLLACTPDAVHGWLIAHDVDGAHRFDQEFRAALGTAATSYDLGPVDALVRHWWTSIWGRAQHLTPEEIAQFRRLDADGDATGLRRHDTHE